MTAEGLEQTGGYVLKGYATKLREGIFDDPVVGLVDALLFQAIQRGASDIHLEPLSDHMRVRYRLDGVLHDQQAIPSDHELFVISRLKVLAHLDITESRTPQDGKIRVLVATDEERALQKHEKISEHIPSTEEWFHFRTAGVPSKEMNAIDLRVATFPSVHGEKMVIRILDRSAHCMILGSLGLDSFFEEDIVNLLQKPHGLMLVTGPTGSGKTTTLYAMLSQLNNATRNIVTMEDPVEYHFSGITQSQINPKAGFTFENGLRSLLRQDPDIIMIGEIRDLPTVQIAIEAALTGHLVLSTLHTNDAAGAITRLIDMGIEPFLINASLTAVIAQRLVRVLCDACKKERALTLAERQRAALYGWDLFTTWVAQGCKICLQVGYKGRTAVFELLVMNDSLRDLVMRKTSAHEIHVKAVHEGMKTLINDALFKVKTGVTSFDEFLRVFIG